MAASKHYGIVRDIAEGEPDGATGALSIASVLADSPHSPPSVVVVGSPTSIGIDLAQLCLTAEQAIQLGAFISAAGADALEADRLDDVSRCAVCGWPLSHSVNAGCVRGNCSARPRPQRLYAPERALRSCAAGLREGEE